MSIFQKFTKKFQPRQISLREEFMQVLRNLLKPNIQFDLEYSIEILAQYLVKSEQHISTLFEFLATITFDFEVKQVIQLLAILHQLLLKDELCQYISIQIRIAKMPWLQNMGTIYSITDQIEKCQQNQLNTTGNEFSNQNPCSNFFYIQQCYFYLQLLSQNIHLYYAVSLNNYPYSNNHEIDHKLMCTWIYKIQNIMNYAIQLLDFNKEYIEIQKVIYLDMIKFHSFICQEITKVLDSYAILGRIYTLNLYEIFCESNKQYEQLRKFWKEIGLQQPEQCLLSNSLLQEFLNFVSKLKLLNHLTEKKKINIPSQKLKNIRKGSQCLNQEEQDQVDEDNNSNQNLITNKSKVNLRLFTFSTVQL